MSDTMADGIVSVRLMLVMNITEELGIDVDLSLPGLDVICFLEQIIKWLVKPSTIRCNIDPEYISQMLKNWSIKHKIMLL